MAEIDIGQAGADALIATEKLFVDEEDWTFPAAGERIARELTSADKRENFMLDITRAQIKLTKGDLPEPGAIGDYSHAARPGRSAAPQPGRSGDLLPSSA